MEMHAEAANAAIPVTRLLLVSSQVETVLCVPPPVQDPVMRRMVVVAAAALRRAPIPVQSASVCTQMIPLPAPVHSREMCVLCVPPPVQAHVMQRMVVVAGAVTHALLVAVKIQGIRIMTECPMLPPAMQLPMVPALSARSAPTVANCKCAVALMQITVPVRAAMNAAVIHSLPVLLCRHVVSETAMRT